MYLGFTTDAVMKTISQEDLGTPEGKRLLALMLKENLTDEARKKVQSVIAHYYAK